MESVEETLISGKCYKFLIKVWLHNSSNPTSTVPSFYDDVIGTKIIFLNLEPDYYNGHKFNVLKILYSCQVKYLFISKARSIFSVLEMV